MRFKRTWWNVVSIGHGSNSLELQYKMYPVLVLRTYQYVIFDFMYSEYCGVLQYDIQYHTVICQYIPVVQYNRLPVDYSLFTRYSTW